MKKDKLESASKIETANCADAQGKAAAASPKAFARGSKTKAAMWGVGVASFALVVGLVACAPSATTGKIEAAPSPNAAAKHATPEADEFGDFWFHQVGAAGWRVYAEAEGYLTRVLEASTVDEDRNMGPIELYRAG